MSRLPSGGPPSAADDWGAAKDAYGETRKPNLPGGWVRDGRLSGPTVSVYARGPDTLLGIRGTKTAADVATWPTVAVGSLRNTLLYGYDKRAVTAALAARPGGRVYFTGHSLGSALGLQLQRDLAGSLGPRFGGAVYFNGALEPQDVRDQASSGPTAAKELYQASDPLFNNPIAPIAGRAWLDKVVYGKPGVGPLAAHSLDAFLPGFAPDAATGAAPPGAAQAAPPAQPGAVATGVYAGAGGGWLGGVVSSVHGGMMPGDADEEPPPPPPPDPPAPSADAVARAWFAAHVAAKDAEDRFAAAVALEGDTPTTRALGEAVVTALDALHAETARMVRTPGADARLDELIEAAAGPLLDLTNEHGSGAPRGGHARPPGVPYVPPAPGVTPGAGEGKDLSNSDIARLAHPDRIVTYPEIERWSAIPPGSTVLLFLTSQGVGHWEALINTGRSIEFFDPYGKPPDADFSWLSPATEAALGEPRRALVALLNQAKARGVQVSWNHHHLQSWAPNVETCGRHVGARVVSARKGWSLDQHVAALGADPDAAVTEWSEEVLGH